MASGLILLVTGSIVFVSCLSLVQAYQARPNALNGGLRVPGYFIHPSSIEALAGLGLGLLIALVGLALAMAGAVRKRPVPLSKTQ